MPAYFNDDLHTLIYKFSKAIGQAQAGAAYDPDAEVFFAQANITNDAAKQRISNWFTGNKQLGVYNNWIESWDSFQDQNIGSGNILYGHKGAYDITLVNSPSWTSNGLSYNGVNQYGKSTLDVTTLWNPGFTLITCANINSLTPPYSMYFGQEDAGVNEGSGMIRKDGINPNTEVYFSSNQGNDIVHVSQNYDAFDLISFRALSDLNLINDTDQDTLARAATVPVAVTDTVGFGARLKNTTPQFFATMVAPFGAVYYNITAQQELDIRSLYASTIGQGLGLP